MHKCRKQDQNCNKLEPQGYSKEELVAEMGAAFLCGHTGIENRTIQNSAAWLRKLKYDKTILIHAAAQAQKTADFILNRKGGEETEEE